MRMRMLRARPGFTAVAVITLALGVGANTAIFSVVRALLLEPLPFPQPDRLVMLWEADASNPERTGIVSAPNYLDWQRGVKAFEYTCIWEYLNYNFSGDGEAERVPGLRVSASAFAMLGVAPELGRTFTPRKTPPGTTWRSSATDCGGAGSAAAPTSSGTPPESTASRSRSSG